MEENNNNENKTHQITGETRHNFHSYWKECTGMLIAAFLGGFLAMYFVADQVFDRHYKHRPYMPDRFERRMLKDFNKMYELERKAFEHDFDKFNSDFEENFNGNFGFEKNNKNGILSNKWFGSDKMNKKQKQMQKFALNPFFAPDLSSNSVEIKTEMDEDKYKVIVGLKSFNDDASNINYNVSGRKLTVFGKSKVKEKNFEQDISFSQDFILPKNADIANITKEQEGNKLVIEVPLRN